LSGGTSGGRPAQGRTKENRLLPSGKVWVNLVGGWGGNKKTGPGKLDHGLTWPARTSISGVQKPAGKKQVAFDPKKGV